VTCHNCSVACAKAGRRPDGMQRYRCGVCGKTFSDRIEHDNLLGQKQAVDDHKALLALNMLVEGNSASGALRGLPGSPETRS
jgi:transposase-like protein